MDAIAMESVSLLLLIRSAPSLRLASLRPVDYEYYAPCAILLEMTWYFAPCNVLPVRPTLRYQTLTQYHALCAVLLERPMLR